MEVEKQHSSFTLYLGISEQEHVDGNDSVSDVNNNSTAHWSRKIHTCYPYNCDNINKNTKKQLTEKFVSVESLLIKCHYSRDFVLLSYGTDHGQIQLFSAFSLEPIQLTSDL